MNTFNILHKHKLQAGLIGVFFISIISIAVWININRVSILVLHSYDPEYIWTKGINEGLARVLESQGWINITYHYMNTKKKPGKENLRRSGIAAINAIYRTRPTVLIAFDDYAQKLAAKNFVNDTDIDIVFGGVNGSIRSYGYHKAKNVTGILERKPVAAIKEVLTAISSPEGIQSNESIRTIFLADGSLSAKKDAEYVGDFDWQPLSFSRTVFCEDFAAWKRAVLDLDPQANYLLVGPYRKLKRTATSLELVPAKEVMSWTSKHSPIPVIGMNVFNTDDGATLSIGVSPYEQGEVTAKLALEIIKGKKPSAIPIQTSQLYIVSMRRGNDGAARN